MDRQLATFEELLKARNSDGDLTGTEQRKEFVAKIKAGSIDEKNFTVEAIVSDESIDSYRDVVLTSAWKKRMSRYTSHPVLISSHYYYDLMNQIGKALSIKISTKNKNVTVKFQYYAGKGNPTADWAWFLVSEGLAAYSVGFKIFDYDVNNLTEDEWKSGTVPWFIYKDVELFEISQVLVPANASCLQKSLTSDNPIAKGIAQKLLVNNSFTINPEIEKGYTDLLKKDLQWINSKENPFAVKSAESTETMVCSIEIDEPSEQEKTALWKKTVTDMVSLLQCTTSPEARSQKAENYEKLVEQYRSCGKVPPVLQTYSFEEDIILGCSDVETALQLLKGLTQDAPAQENKATQSSEDFLERFTALEAKVAAIYDAVSDQEVSLSTEETDQNKVYIKQLIEQSNKLKKWASELSNKGKTEQS